MRSRLLAASPSGPLSARPLSTRPRRMSFSDLIYLYRARLRSRSVLVQDLFAVAGIAVGVALLFASQVASTSLTGSVQQLSGQIVGRVEYQLVSRGPAGVDQRLLTAVDRLPGVRLALPITEAQADLIGPRGRRQSVDLVGADPRFSRIGGPLLRRFSASQLARQQAVALPQPIADEIGAGSLDTIGLQVGAQVKQVLVGTTLSRSQIGRLADSPVALAPIEYAQAIAGMRGRITRVLVQARPGRRRTVARALARIATTRSVTLQPAGYDAKLFAAAALPENQSETLFSAISAIVGFLFALNAMLITVPRRRQFLQHVRVHGASRRMALQILLFDAFIIGALACVCGLGLGELLSITVFHTTPGYLSFAFPVGNARIVDVSTVVLSIAAGMAAACLGVLLPLRDAFLRPRRHRAEQRHFLLARVVLGVLGLGVTTVILLAHPQSSQLANLTLVIALLCGLPFVFDAALVSFARIQPILNRPSSRLALTHLSAPPTRLRSLAIIATAAVAVFGVVAIQGAQQNLQRGLDASARGIDSGADLWISPRGESNAFATSPFRDEGEGRRLAKVPGVRSVAIYRGSFLTWGDRRLWVLAPPTVSRHLIPPSEIHAGRLATATARLRSHGWAVVSQGLAAERHLRIGEAFTLPAPRPSTFRVAALSTNLGWPPGAVIVNADDYARAWGTAEASAYQLWIEPGADRFAVEAAVRRALDGSRSALAVETSSQREQRHFALAGQGLLRLTQIRLLVLIAAVLAIVGALGSLIWQRRGFVAFIRSQGASKRVLWRWLLWESSLLVGLGCLTGAIFGVYGQLLLSHALASVTGFPISFGIEGLAALTTFALVSGAAVIVVAVPGYLTVGVRPRAATPASG
jgi:putative ABC transport system permease protein